MSSSTRVPYAELDGIAGADDEIDEQEEARRGAVATGCVLAQPSCAQELFGVWHGASRGEDRTARGTVNRVAKGWTLR